VVCLEKKNGKKYKDELLWQGKQEWGGEGKRKKKKGKNDNGPVDLLISRGGGNG